MPLAPQSKAYTVLLGLLAGLPALSIDISSPTLTDLPGTLHTTTFVAGLTLSLFMVGFAIGLAAAGRISDRIGRRPVLLSALLTFTVAGAASSLAMTGPELVAARLVQGAGAGGCSVLSYAMVQDLFTGEDARTKRSYITMVLGVVPVLAPALGAWVSAVAGWRSVHIVLVIAGLLLLATASLGVKETRKPAAVLAQPLLSGLRGDRHFAAIAIVNGLSYGSVFAYIAGTPVVTMGHMGLSAGTYATLFACSALSLTAGAWTSARLGRRGLGAEQLARPALIAQGAAAAILGFGGDMLNGKHSFQHGVLLLPMVLTCCFARGVLSPNLIHLAMGARKGDAGVASAALGVVQLLSGALGSAVVAALLPSLHAMAVTLPMAVMATGAALFWFLTRGGAGHSSAEL